MSFTHDPLRLQARIVRVRNRPLKCRWCNNDIEVNMPAVFIKGRGFWHPPCWDEYLQERTA